MNERYKQLAEQAGLKVESFMTNPPKPFQILGSTEQFEKFTDLIVHQMLDIADAHTEVFQTDRDNALIEHIKQSVRQHFGVEE
jgi:hypothetical protein